MKVVINNCFGGFGLSLKGLKRYAELNGRPCYFFKQDGFKGPRIPISDIEDTSIRSLFVSAFDIPNPDEFLIRDDHWFSMSEEQRKSHNEFYSKHSIDDGSSNRSDPNLVKVVEELGEQANGACAKLKIVEIPDGIDWEISEYDGNEHVAEKHQTWG